MATLRGVRIQVVAGWRGRVHSGTCYARVSCKVAAGLQTVAFRDRNLTTDVFEDWW